MSDRGVKNLKELRSLCPSIAELDQQKNPGDDFKNDAGEGGEVARDSRVSGDRFGHHVNQAKCISTQYQVPVPGHGEHRVTLRTDPVEQQAEPNHASQTAEDHSVVGNFGRQ